LANLSQREAAALVGVTPEWLRQLDQRRTDKPPRNKDGTYPRDALLTWWERYQQQVQEGRGRRKRGAESEFDAARARKERALAEKHELQLAVLRGQLMRTELYEERLAAVLARLARNIDSIPTSWPTRLAACGGDPEEIRLALLELVRELRAGMVVVADEIEREAEAEETEQADDRAQPADD